MMILQEEAAANGLNPFAFRNDLHGHLEKSQDNFFEDSLQSLKALIGKFIQHAAVAALASMAAFGPAEAHAQTLPQNQEQKAGVSARNAEPGQAGLTEQFLDDKTPIAKSLDAALAYRAEMNKFAGVTEKDENTPFEKAIGGTLAAHKRFEARHDFFMAKAMSTRDPNDIMYVIQGIDVESMNLEMALATPEAKDKIRQSEKAAQGGHRASNEMSMR